MGRTKCLRGRNDPGFPSATAWLLHALSFNFNHREGFMNGIAAAFFSGSISTYSSGATTPATQAPDAQDTNRMGDDFSLAMTGAGMTGMSGQYCEVDEEMTSLSYSSSCGGMHKHIHFEAISANFESDSTDPTSANA